MLKRLDFLSLQRNLQWLIASHRFPSPFSVKLLIRLGSMGPQCCQLMSYSFLPFEHAQQVPSLRM